MKLVQYAIALGAIVTVAACGETVTIRTRKDNWPDEPMEHGYAVAGMEGALASVVAGLTAKPVIAVPTSVGYGAAFNGISTFPCSTEFKAVALAPE